MIHRHDLNPGVQLELAPGPVLAPDIACAIDRIWTAETAARGAGLFDGPVFSLVEHAPERMTVHETTYRRLIAGRRDPALAFRIGLRPLGVTALLVCPDGVALGRRSRRVHTEAGRWEAAPAGVLDRLDWRAVALGELAEELGIDAGRASGPAAVALIEETSTGTCDILCRLETELRGPEIAAAWRAGGTDEYEDLAILAPDALPGFLEANEDALLPALRPMLQAAGLLSS